jgi:DNA mismatch repair protein MutL
MNRIRLLSEHVANQIAAGEVIERPASVLKELIENSLDAGATQINIIARGGGRTLLQITDNGTGMSKDDALLCLERHATSKLRDSADLSAIASYGFRGEAIPSIASVSKFRLRTREAESLSGTDITVNGGRIVQVQEAGMAPGTQIDVRSLFFNMPARRKFLRTETTETAHLKHQLILAGLGRPDVGFTVGYDEMPQLRWHANQSLPDRIGAIYGHDYPDSLLPIAAVQGDLRLHGFIGKPGVSRANRGEEHVFVNQRPVVNRTIQFALQEGYHNALMRGRFPVAVFFLEIKPEAVDVNIHPAKREVRFHDDFRVRQFVVEAVQSTLRQFQDAPITPSLGADSPPDFNVEPAYEPAVRLPLQVNPSPLQLRSEMTSVIPVQNELAMPAPRIHFQPPPVSSANRLSLRLLGAVANLYIVAESPEGLILIDQHAAHERVLFEQMLRRVAKQEVLSQRLLLPATLNLPPREADFLKAQLPALNQIGLGVSLFGNDSFLVDSLPPMLKTSNLVGFMRTLVVELQENGGETRKERRLSEEIVARTVCRHAVKANDPLKPEEWESLLNDLLECDLPYTCPHGRPTMIQFSLAELDKKFGRSS